LPTTALSRPAETDFPTADDKIYIAPPPHSPRSQASSSNPPSPRPPPFSSLYFPTDAELNHIRAAITGTACESLLATAPAPSFEEALAEDEAESKAAESKAEKDKDTKGESSGKGVDDGEPPPPYTEGPSPIDSFHYVMASAGGPASIITQVQQSPGAPINTLGGRQHLQHKETQVDIGTGEVGADEHITLDLR
jgi:dipeptidyl-peptidase III